VLDYRVCSFFRFSKHPSLLGQSCGLLGNERGRNERDKNYDVENK
jgi:hypothetical protein